MESFSFRYHIAYLFPLAFKYLLLKSVYIVNFLLLPCKYQSIYLWLLIYRPKTLARNAWKRLLEPWCAPSIFAWTTGTHYHPLTSQWIFLELPWIRHENGELTTSFLLYSKLTSRFVCTSKRFSYIVMQLRTINLCRNSLRAIQAAELPPLEQYPKSHIVSYRFFLGFYHFWHEDYNLAQDELMYAFQHCPKSSKLNKRYKKHSRCVCQFTCHCRLILRYLIPISLLSGRLPSLKLLKRHELESIYRDIVFALKTGNLKLFQEAMFANEHSLAEQGTFLVVERVRMLCLRGLFRKVYVYITIWTGMKDCLVGLCVYWIHAFWLVTYTYGGFMLVNVFIECWLSRSLDSCL
jgi:hypothetical protein